MSGDIGRGATRESIAFGLRLASANNRRSGFLQPASGTNAHIVDGLRKQNMFQTSTVSGINLTILYSCWPWCLFVAFAVYRKFSGMVSNSNALVSGIAYGGYARKSCRLLEGFWIDNVVDEIQNGATYVVIDKTSNPRNGSPSLLIQDQSGFKTNSMKLGGDAIVFSCNFVDRKPFIIYIFDTIML